MSDWENIFSKFKHNSIVAGDFNAHHLNWSNRSDSRGTQIYDVALDLGLTPMNNGEHTRLKLVNNLLQKSSPDITFVSSNIAIKLDWKVINENLRSDHLCIKMRYNYHDEIKFSKKFNMKCADWGKYKEYIEDKFQNSDNGEDVQVQYDRLTDLIYSAANASIPLYKIPLNPTGKFIPKSYWCPTLSHKIAQRRLALRKFRKNPTPNNLNLLEDKNSEARSAILKASTENWKGFCDSIDEATTSSVMWCKMKWMKGFKTAKSSVSDERKLNLLCELAPDYVIPSIPNFESTNTKLDSMFSLAEMINCLKVKDTAPGYDGITYSMIWNLPIVAKERLLNIYNNIYRTGSIPMQWRDIKIVVIPKITQPGLPSKLRPISLMSCLCKIFHVMLSKRLEWFVEKNNMLSTYSSGFRRGQSTMDCLARLVTNIQTGFSKNLPTLACYLDIENAYNNILIDKLVNILDSLKVGKSICLYIWNFLTERRLQIHNELNSSATVIRYSRKGLAQGDPLSPLLFNIATYELCQNVINISICQYADDFVLYSTHKHILQSSNRIQQALDIFVKLLDDLGLKLSETKSKYCIYSKGNRKQELNLKINEIQISSTNSYKYLGIWLDKSLRWNKHINETIGKVQRLQNLLKILAGSSWGIHPKHLRRIYIAMIRSRLDYGSCLFDNSAKTHIYKLDKVQNQSMRIIGGFIKSTPIHVMESELSLPPLYLRRRYLSYKYILKSASFSNNVTNLLLDELKALCGNRYWTNKKIPLLITTRAEIRTEEIASSFPLEMFNLTTWVSSIDLREIISINLNCLRNSKKTYDPTVLKFDVIKEISDKYHGWYTLFTDGSKDDKQNNGAAFYDSLVSNNSSNNCFKIINNMSIMSVELIAIFKALDYVNNLQCENILICTDSKSALQHIARCASGRRGVPIAYAILSKILNIIDIKKRLKLQWVPSHIGLRGNEEADKLAKEAVLNGKLILIKPDYTEFISKYKRTCHFEWVEHFKLKSAEKGIWYRTLQPQPPPIPWFINVKVRRRLIVIAHRLRSGHMPLNKFKFLMKISESPLCDSCGVIEDVTHLLDECVRFQSGRDEIVRLMDLNRFDTGMFNNVLACPASKDAISLFKSISLIY